MLINVTHNNIVKIFVIHVLERKPTLKKHISWQP